MMFNFNVNDNVRVRLTARGRKVLMDDHFDFWQEARPNGPVPEYTPPIEDADGWSTWQLWKLMTRFGKHLWNCAGLVFETTIRLDVPMYAVLHNATEVDLFDNPKAAIAFAKATALKHCTRGYIREYTTEGCVYRASYSCEGDSLRVIKREVLNHEAKNL